MLSLLLHLSHSLVAKIPEGILGSHSRHIPGLLEKREAHHTLANGSNKTFSAIRLKLKLKLQKPDNRFRFVLNWLDAKHALHFITSAFLRTLPVISWLSIFLAGWRPILLYKVSRAQVFVKF